MNLAGLEIVAGSADVVADKANFDYGDGGQYEGGWIDEKREGMGKMIWRDGAIYEGNWKNDKRHGKGKLTFISTIRSTRGTGLRTDVTDRER
jgi:hypothetical protein